MRPPVLVVSQHMTRTHGQGRINLEVARALAGIGHAVTVLADAMDVAAGVAWDRAAVPRRVPTNWAREQIFRRRGGRRAAAWRRANPGGVVITNGAAVPQAGDVNLAMFVHAAWLASPWHPRRDGGLRGQYLTAYNRANVPAERRAFRAAGRVVALSQVVRDELIGHVGVEPANIEVVPPGVDPTEFRPAETEAERRHLRSLCGLPGGPGDSPMLLMFAGEIRSPRKNLDLVLRALAAVDGPHLAVAGATHGSPYPGLAADLGLAGRVHFLGHRDDLPALLRGADAFLFPSHYEPFGLVVTEAMASGLPVVVTRQVGAAAFVNDCCGGVLEDGSDLDRLTASVEAWRNDPDRRVAAGAAARSAAAGWTWADMGRRYAAVVDELPPSARTR